MGVNAKNLAQAFQRSGAQHDTETSQPDVSSQCPPRTPVLARMGADVKNLAEAFPAHNAYPSTFLRRRSHQLAPLATASP